MANGARVSLFIRNNVWGTHRDEVGALHDDEHNRVKAQPEK